MRHAEADQLCSSKGLGSNIVRRGRSDLKQFFR